MPTRLKRLALLAISLMVLCSSWVAAQGPLPAETVRAMEARIVALRARLEATETVVANGKKILLDKDPTKIVANASRETQALISRFKDMINEFKTGGDINATLVKADAELLKTIEKYRANPDTRDAAQVLEGVRVSFSNLEKRRDSLLQDAMRQVRLLEANKDKIEAWIVVGDYTKLEVTLTQMLDGLGQLVDDAKKFNTELGTTKDQKNQRE